MKKSHLCTFLLLALFYNVRSQNSPPPNMTILVKYAGKGKPMENAKITRELYNEETKEFTKVDSFYTGPDGKCELDSEVGKYRVKVENGDNCTWELEEVNIDERSSKIKLPFKLDCNERPTIPSKRQ